MALQTKTVSTGDYGWKSWSNGYVISLTLTEESVDISANTSLVSYLFTISNTDNNRFTSNDYSWTISVGGQSIPISHLNFNLGANYTTQTIAAGQITVSHNADGALDMPYSVSIPNVQAWNSYGPPAMSLSGTWGLSGIPREAVLHSAPNFHDEEDPTITYSNPAGTAADSLQACICNLSGTVIWVPYRDIPKTGTGYTFALTDGERTALRNATPNSNTLDVRFVVRTELGGVVRSAALDRKLTIVNAHPVLNATVEDVNPATAELTGDRNVLVRYYSKAEASAVCYGKKGATVSGSDYQVSNGGRAYSGNPQVFNGVENGTFSFSIKDSRGNTTAPNPIVVTKSVIPYVKLTCGLSDNKPQTNGNMTVLVSGNCFFGSFGAVSNALSVQYRYKVSGTAWQCTDDEWRSMTVTQNGDTYTAEATLDGLHYQTAYTFQARAADKLETVFSPEYTARATPVFDWGEQDFNVNGTLRINNAAVADYVIEEANSDGWHYRKWAGGTAECWRQVQISRDGERVAYPLAFSGVEMCTATMNIQQGVSYCPNIFYGVQPDPSSIRFALSAEGGAYPYTFSLYVAGRLS